MSNACLNGLAGQCHRKVAGQKLVLGASFSVSEQEALTSSKLGKINDLTYNGNDSAHGPT